MHVRAKESAVLDLHRLRCFDENVANVETECVSLAVASYRAGSDLHLWRQGGYC